MLVYVTMIKQCKNVPKEWQKIICHDQVCMLHRLSVSKKSKHFESWVLGARLEKERGKGECILKRPKCPLPACKRPNTPKSKPRFFYFLYFSKSFFTDIYFRFHNLQFCTLPPGCEAAGYLPPTGGAVAT